MDEFALQHRQLAASNVGFIISLSSKPFILFVVLLGLWLYFRSQNQPSRVAQEPEDECTVASIESDNDLKDIEALSTDGESEASSCDDTRTDANATP